jgi:hypothetical protein
MGHGESKTRITMASRLWIVAFVGLLVPLGCVEDGTWFDEVTVVFGDSANSLVALAILVEEGNLTGHYYSYQPDETGVVLGEVYGSGEQSLQMVSATPSQRESVLFVVWADDPDQGFAGEPDCDEYGTRFFPVLDEEALTLVFPSQEYPLSWCGALMGPEGVEP